MSGGVDSSVAAALLKKSGKFEVVGCHMKCWSAWDQCSVEKDAEDARAVAEKLEIPFYIFDFEKEYRERVFNYMVREYAVGRTPNPDVFCNSEIKFGIFLEKALALGADFVATGHYVRKSEIRNQKSEIISNPQILNKRNVLNLENSNLEFVSSFDISASNFSLHAARDSAKDQSYFLWRLTQNQFKHALFPIGDYLKSEIREMARKFGLPTADKKDSQGLCFVGKVDFSDFLREILPKNPGPIATTSGKIIGEHDGLNFYTLGQRHGIKIGGTSEPLYVAAKEAATNTLIVAEGDLDPALYEKEIEITDINWIGGIKPELPLNCESRIRYRQPLQKCGLRKSTDGGKVRVVFNEPQKAATPGQSAVFYKCGEMLGGGIIK